MQSRWQCEMRVKSEVGSPWDVFSHRDNPGSSAEERLEDRGKREEIRELCNTVKK